MVTKLFFGFVTDRNETSSRITHGYPPLARSHTHRPILAAADRHRAPGQLADGHRGDPGGVLTWLTFLGFA
jgi:hypothetical protein